MPKELSEIEASNRAILIWNDFGEPLGLSVYGFTYFHSASFVDKNNMIISGTMGGGSSFIKGLKSIREHVTGKKFIFPVDYYMED